MKVTCPKCGHHHHEVKTKARKGGKARWQNTTPEQLSEIARAAVKARWAKAKAKQLEQPSP